MPLVSKTFDQLLDFTRTSAATFVGSNGLVQTTAASRNLLLWTQQFDNAAWPKTALTATANTVTAPDGTSTADTLIDTVATSNHYAAQTITTTAATTYTMSAYVKNNGRGFVILNLANLSGATNYAAVSFNLSTGAVVNTLANGTGYSVSSSSITSVGDGWYRCTMTAVVGTTTATTASVALSTAGTIGAYGLDSYLGNGSGVFIWGAQLEVVPAANLVLGSELVTNGTFSGGSTTGWTAAGSATISGTGDVLTVTNGATAFGYAVTSITTVIGRTYYVTYQITGGTSTANLYIGTASGGFDNYAGPNQSAGSYAVSFVATATTTFLRLGNSVNTSGATSIFDNVSTKEITAITGMPSTYTRNNGGVFPPRFDYDPVTLAPKGILIEEQRVNRTLQSEDFTVSPWAATVVGTSTRVNTNTALGFMRGLVTATSANGGIRQTYSGLASGQVYALSFYIQSTTTAVSVFMENGTVSFGGPHSVTINPSNGTAGALTGFTSVTITPFSSGYIYTLITAPAGGTLLANFEWRIVTSGDSFQYGRPQFEAGAFATSYIPTVASQVTRTADQTSIVAPNFAPWYNQSEGTLVFEGSRLTNSSFSYPVVATDNSNSNRFGFYQSGSTVAGFISASGATQLETTSSPIVANVPFKMALAAQANNGNFSFNGNIGTNDTTITMPTVNRLFLGAGVSGANDYLNGHIRSIRYYPTRLTNAQLQALTA